jgi:large subunit ribosomal protein L18
LSVAQRRMESRVRRHERVRRRLAGSTQRPRLAIFKSSKHLYAQLVDDSKDRTITGVSTLTPSLREKCDKLKGVECAKVIGETIAQAALDRQITEVVFDRGGFKYMGKVKILAEAARAKGLKF